MTDNVKQSLFAAFVFIVIIAACLAGCNSQPNVTYVDCSVVECEWDDDDREDDDVNRGWDREDDD